MILGIGIEMLDSAPFQVLVAEGRLEDLERWFTDAERSYCLTRNPAGNHLAARFAAKAAALKALGLERSDAYMLAVEVVRNSKGKPSVALAEPVSSVARSRGIETLYLSISHSGGHAVASVLAEGEALATNQEGDDS